MNIKDIELCASYWTVSGAVYPGAPSEISPFPLKDRAEIAGRVGWRGMGFVLDDMNASIAQYGLPTVRNIFSDNGIRHVELEFLVDWHLDGEKRRASDATYDRLLDVGAELGIKKIKIGGGVFEEGEPDVSAMRSALATICERAAPLGIDIVIEFLPFASINSIDRGLALFEGLGTTNGGLLVDTWHVERGGMTADDIRKIPRDLLRAVELDDAGPEVLGGLFNDSTHYRRLCGEGSIDIVSQIQAIVDVGYRGYWGVEVISAYHRHLPLDIAAQRAFDATMQQFRSIDFPSN
ncbi:sugar phosphate isomerase/epimerase [Rhizobium leguminosarum]|uniref:sugar phosphate isomerase/epimerase family protein n=1 Tax=Rhizobium leguminosarum TaxID=384 RepID=UPI001C9117D4|nr:sugar phosphate isomerase/epimerase [Rhizobium leguminosarum]MBY2924381.1 sugar phosphate isomerase/epimerase [Rhizobium leguminosarum]